MVALLQDGRRKTYRLSCINLVFGPCILFSIENDLSGRFDEVAVN